MSADKTVLFLFRVSMGWLFLYAGIAKILDPNWSAAGYVNSALTFPNFYHWFATPGVLPAVNIINEWALFLLGVSLILGLFVRLSSTFGMVLMLLYYFPVLAFPHVGKNYFLIDDHIIFFLGLLLLAQMRAGRYWGFDGWCSKRPFCVNNAKLRSFLG